MLGWATDICQVEDLRLYSTYQLLNFNYMVSAKPGCTGTSNAGLAPIFNARNLHQHSMPSHAPLVLAACRTYLMGVGIATQPPLLAQYGDYHGQYCKNKNKKNHLVIRSLHAHAHTHTHTNRLTLRHGFCCVRLLITMSVKSDGGLSPACCSRIRI